ncbi:hypothetical protein P7C73_g6613, partial [Tremellales sp. Uapishka_1]
MAAESASGTYISLGFRLRLDDEQYHPDKRSLSAPSQTVDIGAINHARFVLSDPARRREYNSGIISSALSHHPLPFVAVTSLTCLAAPPTTDAMPHVSHDISLSQFTPHGVEGPADTPSYYTYPCRCSREFRIAYSELEAGIEIIGCDGCGEWIRVGYQEDDGEDEDDEQDDKEVGTEKEPA